MIIPQKHNKKIIPIGIIIASLFLILDTIGKKQKYQEERTIDKDNQYRERENNINVISVKETNYQRIVKPAIDRVLSFTGLVILSPLYLIISLAIIADDPGPVLFEQKRVGKDKHYFQLHKFRTMKTNAPHEVPTQQLSNPDRYITKVGRILRKTSLDELPQIWDIFVGNMSIIGPRPALWNQKDLVTERDKYCANNVKPGLTGWAQINGRDELQVNEKAKFDGEYVAKIAQSDFNGLLFDMKCFFCTIPNVTKGKDIVEGYRVQASIPNANVTNRIVKVSVITPAYNAGKYISKTIDTVEKQTYTNWEMIIVDDCSSDNTLEIAKKYAEKDSRIKVITLSKNGGVSASRNVALEIATGKYIAFLDSDDQWMPEKLEHQLNFMENNQCVLTYTAYQKFNSYSGKKGRVIFVPDCTTVDDIYKNSSIACLTVMINREKSGSFTMPKLQHMEDQITWQKILRQSSCLAYGINENLALYREGNDSLTNNHMKVAMEQWHIYRDYYKFPLNKALYYYFNYIFNAMKKHN